MVVYVIDDLEHFKECARSARIKLWKEKKLNGEVEIRMKAGTVGFRKVYETSDPELAEVRKMIEVEDFVELVDVESDDTFFLF
ncbi:hypothetical protein DRP07_00175 [Archaeoglobales archaeon]|nr:MAG: hypothetical protein DRP07_00175 [Archaeoglobales archaeon]